MDRRRFLATFGAAGAGAAALSAYGALIEPRRLDVTRHRIDPHPPAGGASLTFVQITDLHLQKLGRVHHRIAAEVARIRPDFLVFTGDSIDRRDRLPLFADFLSLLDPRTPKYAIPGNWEHWGEVDLDDLGRLYARHGGRLLVNETAVHEHAGKAIAITGLDDLLGGRPDLRAALRGVEPAPAHLLLMHCPEYRDGLADAARPLRIGGATLAEGIDVGRYDFRMMLSGHTHGGQVSVLGVAPMVPRGSGRYVRGWFRDGGGPPLYVSRGVGTSVLPVRIGSVPEIAVFTMPV